MLPALPSSLDKKVKEAYKEDPVGIVTGLRECVKNVLYTLLNNTNLVE